MRRLPFVLLAITLGACQANTPPVANVAANVMGAAPAAPSKSSANISAAPVATAPTPATVPASYDWLFVTHGGSGNLMFGDGDPAEGVALLSLSCLPASGRTAISTDGQAAATLRADGRTLNLGEDIALDHPVLRAFAAAGSVGLVSGGSERLLAAKPGAGRTAVESFFAYCAAAPAAR